MRVHVQVGRAHNRYNVQDLRSISCIRFCQVDLFTCGGERARDEQQGRVSGVINLGVSEKSEGSEDPRQAHPHTLPLSGASTLATVAGSTGAPLPL
jgi:hypothetical protein